MGSENVSAPCPGRYGSTAERTRAQFFRFLAVGGINTTFSYGIYAGLVSMGSHYAAANLVAVTAGVFFSFRTTGRFVFGRRDNRRFGRFVLAWSAIYVASVGVIGALLWMTGNPYAAGAMAIPPTAVMSYVVQRFFVFRTDVHEPDPVPSTDRFVRVGPQDRAS